MTSKSPSQSFRNDNIHETPAALEDPHLPSENISGTHVSSERTGPAKAKHPQLWGSSLASGSYGCHSGSWSQQLPKHSWDSFSHLGTPASRGPVLDRDMRAVPPCPRLCRGVAPVHMAHQILVCLSLPWGKWLWPVGEAVSKSTAARFSGRKKGACTYNFHRR